MTPSDKLILIETRAMIDRLMAMTDVVEMFAFISGLRSDYSIGTSDLSALTGVDGQHFINVSRAAGAVLARGNGSTGYPEEFKPLVAIYDGKALNRDDHGLNGWEPWTDDWWLKECPPRWSDHVLRQAHDNAARVPWIAALYLENDQRLPDQAGFEYWTAQMASGLSKEDAAYWMVKGLLSA